MFFKWRKPTAGSFINFIICINLLTFTVYAENDVDVDSVLEKIFSPSETSIHTQALRRDIIRRLYDALQREQIEDDLLDYKRSINSLARWDNLPGKRNLAALARGGYIKTLPDEEGDEDNDDKRSIAIMAKNGQLPHLPIDEEKRGIEALARNGELYHNKREIQELIDELYDKRNIGSLARNYNFPSYGKRYLGSLARSNSNFQRMQRNIASIARDGMRYNGKRNLASFLRQSSLNTNNNDDKRNVGAAKASGFKPYKRSVDENQRDKRAAPANDEHDNLRYKRDADYFEVNDEYASPVYQNQNVFDYEELMKALTGEYPNTDKRFLGSVARSGWFRGPSGSSRFSRIDKRHIGSLARLGWLPSFRSVRRFNRSGRSISDCDRETTADGETEDNALAENQLPVKDNQFLFPQVNRIMMKAE